MDTPATIQFLAIGIFLSLLLMEILIARHKQRKVFDVKDSVSNVGMMIFSNTMLHSVTLAWLAWLLALVTPWQLFSFNTSILTFVITFIATDFVYYWYHRVSHETRFLWTLHHTHHSSLVMNFTTAVRLNWVGKFVSPVFFLPLVLLGLPAEYVFGSLFLGLLYQLFLHTEFVPRLGWFEGKLLNTPSAHRVHHGSNPLYIDKNYAAVFIVWDRLFGTYQAEVEPVKYGTTDGFIGYNPLAIQFSPLIKYCQRLFKKRLLRVS